MRRPEPMTSEEARELLGATLHGRPVLVRRLIDAQTVAGAGDDAVVVVPKLDAATWDRCRVAGVAAVVAPSEDVAELAPPSLAEPALWGVADTRLALARLSRRLDNRPRVAERGVHPSAVVADDALLGERVAVGPLAVVGANVELGDDVVVGPGAVVGAGARIGPGSVLRERVVVADGVTVGARCTIQAGAVIGSDGFGYVVGPRGAERVHHLGTVVLGDDVDIGANTCVDRATLGATVVGARGKLDNLVQVAHNVRLGCDVLVAGQAGIAGSTVIGDRVVIGGAAGITDHVRVGDDVHIAGGAGVTKSVPDGETWGGFPAQPVRQWIRERYLIGRLEKMWAHLKGRV